MESGEILEEGELPLEVSGPLVSGALPPLPPLRACKAPQRAPKQHNELLPPPPAVPRAHPRAQPAAEIAAPPPRRAAATAAGLQG